MGFTQQNGDIEGISTPIYWRIGTQHCNRESVQEIITDAEGNGLDTDGNIIPMVNGQYPADCVFAYNFTKTTKWTVTFYAYLTKDESDEWEKTQRPPRKTQVFKFGESVGNMAPLSGSAIAGMYNHPLLQAQIPADWISDEV
jgi:hypothetical protein